MFLRTIFKPVQKLITHLCEDSKKRLDALRLKAEQEMANMPKYLILADPPPIWEIPEIPEPESDNTRQAA